MSLTSSSESVVLLTANAAEQVKTLLASDPENAGKSLRIYVEGGGCCGGSQYGMVFDERREGDAVAAHHGVDVLVDAASADVLRGSTIDFVESGGRAGFTLNNPNRSKGHSHGGCGCGDSSDSCCGGDSHHH